jgi:hypothetical protein
MIPVSSPTRPRTPLPLAPSPRGALCRPAARRPTSSHALSPTRASGACTRPPAPIGVHYGVRRLRHSALNRPRWNRTTPPALPVHCAARPPVPGAPECALRRRAGYGASWNRTKITRASNGDFSIKLKLRSSRGFYPSGPLHGGPYAPPESNKCYSFTRGGYYHYTRGAVGVRFRGSMSRGLGKTPSGRRGQ